MVGHQVMSYGGSFLLLAATVLLIITTISAPVVPSIAIFTVPLDDGSWLAFGVFGYCLEGTTPSYCSRSTLGYSVDVTINLYGDNTFSTGTANLLTTGMILHPIAAFFAFLACLLALRPNCCGAILSSLICAVTWIITLIAMAFDFVTYRSISRVGITVYYGTATWTILVAMILIFFSTFIVLFSCCTSRRHNKATTGQAQTTVVVKSGGVETVVETHPRNRERCCC